MLQALRRRIIMSEEDKQMDVKIDNTNVDNTSGDKAGGDKVGRLERTSTLLDRLMWIMLLVQVVVTVILNKYMPESVPMHFDGDGNIDRYGSKYELYFLVGMSVFLVLMMKAFIKPYKEKAEKAEEGHEKAAAVTNRYVFTILGVASVVIMIGVEVGLAINGIKHAQAPTGTPFVETTVIIMNCFIGLIMIILGNVMPKSRINGAFGVRTSWSSYNDETWARSNRFGGKACVVCGIVSIIQTLFVSHKYSSLIAVLLIVLMAIVCTVASYKIYVQVREKEQN